MTVIDQNIFPKIKITHVPTGEMVEFDPYIESFSDNFNSEWDSTQVFGRMDDIRNFKRTSRVISLSWNIISEDLASARINYENCSTLMRMLYPVYQDTTEIGTLQNDVDLNKQQEVLAQRLKNLYEANLITPAAYSQLESSVNQILQPTKQQQNTNSNIKINSRKASIMSSPPILKINFANLIKNSDGNELYGTIEGLKYEPDTEMGFFIENDGATQTNQIESLSGGAGSEQMMYPKVLTMSFSFTVIHTSPLGWKYDTADRRYVARSNSPFHVKK